MKGIVGDVSFVSEGCLPEDLTRDGIVDGKDMAEFNKQYRKTGDLTGDFNKDGKVDATDLLDLRRQMGRKR